MANQQTSATRIVVGCAAAVCLFTLAAVGARAQRSATSGPPPTEIRDPFAEARERQRREAELRSAEIIIRPRPAERRDATVGQMREDFRQIQILRNNIVRHLTSEKPLDYKFIASEAEEISRRAGRLKARLVREAAAGDEEKKEREQQFELGDTDVKAALVRMCRRIDSFIDNPMFKVPEVIDVEQSARAGRDLFDIIQLSGGIRRAAERQHKTSKK
jgi:hypothetical protein